MSGDVAMTVGVKFKPYFTDTVLTNPYFDAVNKAKSTMNDLESPEPDISHLDIYTLVFFTNKEKTNEAEHYYCHLSETYVGDLEHYKKKADVVLSYAQNNLQAGEITGYRIKGYKMSPFQNKSAILMNSWQDFQVKKKTFLNGPLKDNEFLKQKGKHYA